MRFAHPAWLAAAPAALVLLPLSWWLLDRWRRQALERFAAPPTLARIAPGRAGAVVLARRVLALVAVLCLALSAARPQWGSSSEAVRRRGLDVAFLVDTSLSMEAPATPGSSVSRLVAARRAVSDLLEMLRGDRAAVVVFAGEAQLLCPLTIDQGALKLLLDTADPDLLPTAGTDIGAGIRKAVGAFRSKERKFKAIVILSDGEDNEGKGVEAAREAREQGAVVHAVGYGSTTGEPIPLRDGSGKVSGYKKDSAGHVVSTRLEEATLRAVAEAGAGVYVAAASGERGLRAIADEIAAMEKREFEASRTSQVEERFEWPLLAAFLCLALEALLGLVARGIRAPVLAARATTSPTIPAPAAIPARRAPRPAPGPAPPGPVRAILLLAFLAPALEVATARAATPAEEGRRAFEAKQYERAAELFRKALEEDPGSAPLRYNLGTALLAAGKGDEAIAELSRAAADGSKDLGARAHYNAGNAYYAAGKRKEALEEYRQALRKAPPDLDAKHNYELVQRELRQQPQPSPTPTPSPSPEARPSPSPTPSPSPQGQPSPSPTPTPSASPAGSPTPTPSPGGTPSPDGEPSPSPSPGASPTPGEGMGEEQAEQLLEALEAQEAAERKEREKARKAEVRVRRPAKDW